MSAGIPLPRNGRLLGFDVGEMTIGLAMTDAMQMIASPLVTLKKGRWADNAAELLAISAEHGIAGLVIGLPVNMDGSIGARGQSTRQFARNAQKALALPAALWDERLSTAVVEKAMLEADLSRQKRKKQVDKLAAAYILQSFLDATRR